jgi:hypothetical protein
VLFKWDFPVEHEINNNNNNNPSAKDEKASVGPDKNLQMMKNLKRRKIFICQRFLELYRY